MSIILHLKINKNKHKFVLLSDNIYHQTDDIKFLIVVPNKYVYKNVITSTKMSYQVQTFFYKCKNVKTSAKIS